MPAYLIRRPGKPIDDILIAGPNLTLGFTNGWATLKGGAGICFAIPAQAGAHIERVDEPQEPAPTKE
ncbi:hypothetical protein ABZ438_08165 [Streptomyces sp. NPDC005786]|uniref:hypothetical protein n=1 Tax=Streptomyces sp. NPDC005786 TaxID=3154891 RepID=UPI0033F80C74